ncbi:MAG: Unknown protein [uncultured Thiotrichaceae bacterium]|uniref:Uncharacterized protein n=1 Tax=uncultured Thiotrichaceae bacterium TaxID=298394 RepID=A0A6S6TP39_9GAMM|nr:MAG: Unknown protein [uncultured Thiotrichaceae bacterium]
MNTIIKLIITATLLTGVSGASMAAWADNNTSEVRLVATIDDGPAFQPVEWTVFRVDNPSAKIADKTRRHSFTLRKVKPGRYTAIVKRGEETRRRDFYVMADTTSRVRIPVD